MKIRLALPDIQKDSIVDGEGIRSVIWTQGCPHNCLGCHNPETHNLRGGTLVDIEKILKKIDKLEGQDGVTFSGGDPMMQPEECAVLAEYCQDKGLNVWCYTGYLFEDLLKLSKKIPAIMDFLKQIDVLIDGKFVLSEKSFDTVFRGSRNQRIIDVKKSLKNKKTVLVKKYDETVNNNRGRKNHYMFV